MKHTKIAIIGAGNVGATTAYALLLKNLAGEILLVDKDEIKCDGQVRDLSDALPFSDTAIIKQANLKEAGNADIIVITAGVGQLKPGQTRLDLVEINQKILQEIFNDMQPLNQNAIIIMVANPVDVLTLLAQKLSNLPANQVIGSGTLLDTQRLRGYLSEKMGVAEQSINAFVLGEHGDSQFVPWSSAYVAGKLITDFPDISLADLNAIAVNSMHEAYKIISGKGATYYGIATCISKICEAIIFNHKEVLPISSYHQDLGVCLSLPTVLGEQGVIKIITPNFTLEETQKLQQSALALKNFIK